MDASLWVAKTGLNAQQTRMSVIANNLANVNTTGFKRDRPVFEDLLYQNIRQAGGQTGADTNAATGFMLGTGTRIVATEKIQAQGNMMSTENALDLAIEGPGFFQIVQADGTIGYTRDGGFKLSQEGELVTPQGLLLQPQIVVPPEAASVTIGNDGTVSAELANGVVISSLVRFRLLVLLTARVLKPWGKIFSEKRLPVVRPLYLYLVSRGREKLLRACLRHQTSMLWKN